MSGNVLAFLIRDGAPVTLLLRQYESRSDNALELLHRLVALDPTLFNGRTGVIFSDDTPATLEQEWVDYELRFCTTKVQGEVSPFLPFPDGHALRWVQTRLPDGDALVRDFLANVEPYTSERIFWLGADTHPSRQTLVSLATRHTNVLDCAFMSWDRRDPNLLWSPQFVSLWDHRRYKYLVDCPGVGWSGRLKWLIASGRPVFVVERPFVEPWHEHLVPWVHFVPVRSNLSDLLKAHARLEASPELYASISYNAKRFAREHLLLDRQLEATLVAVRAAVLPPIDDFNS